MFGSGRPERGGSGRAPRRKRAQRSGELKATPALPKPALGCCDASLAKRNAAQDLAIAGALPISRHVNLAQKRAIGGCGLMDSH
jgi:hypothetical protein